MYIRINVKTKVNMICKNIKWNEITRLFVRLMTACFCWWMWIWSNVYRNELNEKKNNIMVCFNECMVACNCWLMEAHKCEGRKSWNVRKYYWREKTTNYTLKVRKKNEFHVFRFTFLILILLTIMNTWRHYNIHVANVCTLAPACRI